MVNLNELLKGYRITVFDLETTGLSKEFDRIIELGVVEVVDGEIKLEFSRLFGGGKSKPSIVEIHNITDDMRKGEESFEDRAVKIAKYFNGAILMGHNLAKFDLPMMQERMKIAGQKLYGIEGYIDTYQLCKKHKIGTRGYKLENLCKDFDIVHGNHRALGDAQCTWELFKKIVEILQIKKLSDIINKK